MNATSAEHRTDEPCPAKPSAAIDEDEGHSIAPWDAGLVNTSRGRIHLGYMGLRVISDVLFQCG